MQIICSVLCLERCGFLIVKRKMNSSETVFIIHNSFQIWKASLFENKLTQLQSHGSNKSLDTIARITNTRLSTSSLNHHHHLAITLSGNGARSSPNTY